MPQRTELQTLVSGLSFAEAPRWRDGKLWFSDFYTFLVQTVTLKGTVEVIAEVPQRPSGLGFMPDGSVLVVSMVDRKILRLSGGELRVHADLAHLATGLCNDMVVDAAGRAYVGNFGYDRHHGAAARETSIIRVDPDGRTSVAADGLAFPNGCVISADGRTFVVAESDAARLTSFDILPNGELTRRRVFAELGDCIPDGIVLDADGAIWVADAKGRRLIRVLEGGRIARTITTGDRHAYACMLGGPERTTLFVCTNSGAGPAMASKRDGRIEVIDVDAAGVGLP